MLTKEESGRSARECLREVEIEVEIEVEVEIG